MTRALRSLTGPLAHIPEGSSALFFIQIFSTLGFAVLYSTLVLYTTRHLQFSIKEATAIMGVFGAFNYGLHLFGGYLGGRFLSNRNLFVGGMALQVLGCAWIAIGTVPALYGGLALFLTGSGLNVTCINMMLTQRFAPADNRREAAFLWNYAGMNVGFFIGFAVAGHYQLTESYTRLFLFATVGNFLAIVLAILNWRRLKDLSTPLLAATPAQFRWRFAVGVLVLVGVPPVVGVMLQHTGSTGIMLKAFCAAVAAWLVYLTIRHPDRLERNNMWAYLVLMLGSLVFWSLYQMAPSGLQLFAVNNVDLQVWGITVAPQWIQNINTVVIVFGGPMLAALFASLRAHGWYIDLPKQFAVSLILMGLGFLALPAGITLADDLGRVAFFWLFLSYVLQSVGELLISPSAYVVSGEEYLEQIFKLKEKLSIPVIASLNGSSLGGWTRYANLLEQAGADALELNIYFLAADPGETAQSVETRYLEILRAVRKSVTIPVAVKLGPFFSAFAHMARELDAAGADGLVLFNRFYQPDLDLEEMEVVPNVLLSTPQGMRLPLRWVAILHGRLKANLAASGGVHSAQDVLKMLLVGADVTQMASALLERGPDHVRTVLTDLRDLMDARGMESVRQIRGSMCYRNVRDPAPQVDGDRRPSRGGHPPRQRGGTRVQDRPEQDKDWPALRQ